MRLLNEFQFVFHAVFFSFSLWIYYVSSGKAFYKIYSFAIKSKTDENGPILTCLTFYDIILVHSFFLVHCI